MFMTDLQNSDAVLYSKLDLDHAKTLHSKACFYCDQPAVPDLALEVSMHNPKTTVWRGNKKQWVTANIQVPRCEQCFKVDQKQKRYGAAYIFFSLLLGAAGLMLGIVTYDIHKSDALPIILAVLGFGSVLAFYAFRLRALLRSEGHGRLRVNPMINYEPIQYLTSKGWRLGLGGV
jgi:hypothetical protein